MGYYLHAEVPEGTRDGASVAKVGRYGAQDVLAGLFFAGYAADRRPASNRVCAWVTDVWQRWGGYPTDAPWVERNRPATVRAAIAYSYGVEGNTILHANRDTITLGLKFKPVTDPPLAALVEFYQGFKPDLSDRWDPPAVGRIADAMEGVLDALAPSTWHSICVDVAGVFRYAAQLNLSVTGG